MISDSDKKSLKIIENAIVSGKPISKKAIDMIEDQFAVYGYLKSLLEMKENKQL